MKKSIGEILKESRKKYKLSAKFVCEQLEIVDGIKISPTTLYGYENNYREPDIHTLLALCDMYDLDDLLVTFGYSSQKDYDDDSEQELKQSEKEEKILLLFNTLNPVGQQKAVDYVEDLAGNEKYCKPFKGKSKPRAPSATSGDDEKPEEE